MQSLHNHPGCTRYLHDLLDIIHDDMIVVLSQKKCRIRSESLLAKIQDLDKKITEPAYGQEPCPERRDYGPPVGIPAELNNHAKGRLNDEQNHAKLTVFKGVTARSKTIDQLKRVE